MSFGGLGGCLPLRLGRGDDTGVSAACHARFSADLLAVRRTSPIASITLRVVTVAPGDGVTVIAYSGANGNGPQYSPICTLEYGVVTISLATAVNSFGNVFDLSEYTRGGIAVSASYQDSGGTWYPATPTTQPLVDWVQFEPAAQYNPIIQIDIYGTSQAAIGDYGAHQDKHDSVTEGGTSYAWQWYEYLKIAQGSAYSASDTSVRSWGLKAEARALGTSQRHSEMLAAASTPSGADAKLNMWAVVLGVQQANRPKYAIRDECESRARLATAPTHAYLTAAISDILGRRVRLDGIAHNVGTMSSWPEATYWPGVVNGPAMLDMGDGVWSTSRARLTLQVTALDGSTPAALTDLMSRDVARFMDRTLPAVDTWCWETGAGAGFILDTSALDLTAL